MGQINPGLIVAGRYRLLRKLGQGGMGTVWAARNELIDRDVAIKMMRPEAAANPVSLQRFFTEAKASGRLRHPNITEIYDLGQAEDGSPFLVLELLHGEPLDAVLRRVPTLGPIQVLLMCRALAAGLHEAHAKGIIHRDLKPANIYFHRDPITQEIIPKILDFGISKVTGPEAIDYHATHTGTVVGSPTYMSPEQARGMNDVDARADIWALGVLAYKCLTGRAPFNAANYNALMVAIMTEQHTPVTRFVPTIPPQVSELVDDCLRKERNERIASARALLQRVDSCLLALNAERARIELPGVDESDDDMPTIARGDRRELLALLEGAGSAEEANLALRAPVDANAATAASYPAPPPRAETSGRQTLPTSSLDAGADTTGSAGLSPGWIRSSGATQTAWPAPSEPIQSFEGAWAGQDQAAAAWPQTSMDHAAWVQEPTGWPAQEPTQALPPAQVPFAVRAGTNSAHASPPGQGVVAGAPIGGAPIGAATMVGAPPGWGAGYPQPPTASSLPTPAATASPSQAARPAISGRRPLIFGLVAAAALGVFGVALIVVRSEHRPAVSTSTSAGEASSEEGLEDLEAPKSAASKDPTTAESAQEPRATEVPPKGSTSAEPGTTTSPSPSGSGSTTPSASPSTARLTEPSTISTVVSSATSTTSAAPRASYVPRSSSTRLPGGPTPTGRSPSTPATKPTTNVVGPGF